MRMPIPDVVQTRGEALMDLELLRASIWAKAEPAPNVAPPWTSRFLDKPLFPVDPRE